MRRPVPDLHDDQIGLRPPAPGDVDAVTAAVQDPAIPRFTMVPTPYTRDDAVAWVARSAAAWRRGDDASFVIVDQATGALLGGIGLHQFDAEAGTAVIGYWVAADARRRGVATRAVSLVAGWALDPLGLTRVTAQVYADNAASQRVLERVGFVRDAGAPSVAEHATGLRPAIGYTLAAGDPWAPAG